MEKNALCLDPRAPTDARVRDLLSRMSLEEKVAQLGSIWVMNLLEGRGLSRQMASSLLGNGIGQVTRVAGSRVGLEPKEAAEVANQIQRFLVKETRLGIPAMMHEECLSGVMAKGATSFPQAIGLASTWNTELVQKVTSAIRVEMRTIGAHQGLAPVLDVARDPRWGRTEETFGEDPYLVAAMGTAYIRGLQGEGPTPSVIATAKHFAAHGLPEGGRNCAPVRVQAREFREVFLYPFEAGVKEAAAGSVMNAYHEMDGVPCAASHELLTETLRGEWGFEGFVVSDYYAIRMLKTFHGVASDEKEAAAQAIEAGIDMELPNSECYGEPLIQAFRESLVSEATINRAVSRVLRAKFILGLFENPYLETDRIESILNSAHHQALSLEAARKSIVLLKNNGVLPLDRRVKSLAVVGPNADSVRNLLGDYHFAAHVSGVETQPRGMSILEALRSRMPSGTSIRYAKGCEITGDSREGFDEAIGVAEECEAVVAVVGERSGFSESDVTGEGRDSASLRLQGVQEELMEALCEIRKPLIIVLVNGRPLSIGKMVERASAVLEAWLPGEQGGIAVVDVLLGDVNPSGRLPISFPSEAGQIPVHYYRKPSSFRGYVASSAKPLYPFGFGLSYTRFEYGSLKITPDRVGSSERVEVTFQIENVGKVKGDEVAQLYIRDEVASLSRPVKELKGFKRVPLEPGERKTVRFTISTEQLAFYDRWMRLVVEPGTFSVMVGPSSEDNRLTGDFEISGGAKVISSRSTFFSDAHVLS